MDATFLKQLFVATSAQLAAVTAGGLIGFPSILLQQFRQTDSIIKVDFHTESWIAAMPGIAGIPSMLVPYLMQRLGRRFAFRLNCLFIIIGWVIIYSAKSSLSIILGELFQGIGNKSMTVTSYATLSEMMGPRFRNKSLVLNGIAQGIGITMVHILGRNISFRILCMVLSGPIIVAFLLSFIWPESPAWLAYKGKFEESKKSFIWLRGQNKEAQAEMNILLNTQRVAFLSRTSQKKQNEPNERVNIIKVWAKVSRRDFYLPTFHMLVLISCYYFSGNLTVVVYAINLIEKLTTDGDTAFIGTVVIDIFVILGNIACPIVLIYLDNKTVLLLGGIVSVVSLIASSMVSYLQVIDVIASDSLLCLIFLTCFMVFSSFGLYCVPFSIAAEIIPLRHRGLTNSLYVFSICTFYTTTIKLAPYLILYISVHGMLLIYAMILSSSLLFVWKYIPETKNRTLHSIEQHYLDKKRKKKTDHEKNIMLTENITEDC